MTGLFYYGQDNRSVNKTKLKLSRSYGEVEVHKHVFMTQDLLYHFKTHIFAFQSFVMLFLSSYSCSFLTKYLSDLVFCPVF